MTQTERTVELTLIAMCTGLTWLAGDLLAGVSDTGRVALTCAGVLLAQSLIRDFWFVWSKRGHKPTQAKHARCMCVESTLGMLGIVVGAVVLLAGFTTSLQTSALFWATAVGLTLVLGYFIKDYVLTWFPVRFKKDPDHMNIIVKW